MKSKEIGEAFTAQGALPNPTPTANVQSAMTVESARWGRIVSEAAIPRQ
jgi:hypothetical protein